MSKRKRPFEVSKPVKKDKSNKRQSSKKNAAGSQTLTAPQKAEKQSGGFFADAGVRETIESIVVAVILALLFRAYEAEAFVIPTGSMAPTLQGRHVDIHCKFLLSNEHQERRQLSEFELRVGRKSSTRSSAASVFFFLSSSLVADYIQVFQAGQQSPVKRPATETH